MAKLTGTDSAMDLSLRNPLPGVSAVNSAASISSSVKIIKPIPKPPWSILWYRNLWSLTNNENEEVRNKVESSEATIQLTPSPPLGLLNCLKTTSENRSGTYEFPFSQFINHEEQQRNACGSITENYIQNKQRHTSLQETAADQLDQMREKEGQNLIGSVVVSNSGGDCSCDPSLSIDDDEDFGNESENSENIVVTTITTDDADESGSQRGDNSLRSSHHHHEDYEAGNALGHHHHKTTVILDVACCDGPVHFKRISNPNFAVTVEHNEICLPVPSTSSSSAAATASSLFHNHFSGKNFTASSQRSNSNEKKRSSSTSTSENFSKVHGGDQGDSGGGNLTTLKTYLCIYCNQSFKSLFCYQKHKKRHLNPVSVDITTTMENSTSHQRTSSGGGGGGDTSRREVTGTCSSNRNCKDMMVGISTGGALTIPDNNNAKAKTKDLNVQFFPCKKCGSKFPSYYFVHKHRKICH